MTLAGVIMMLVQLGLLVGLYWQQRTLRLLRESIDAQQETINAQQETIDIQTERLDGIAARR